MKKLIRTGPLVTKAIKDLQSGFAKVNHVIYKTNERRKKADTLYAADWRN